MIGRGKYSRVLVAHDSTGKAVCLKMEPLANCKQSSTEISVLEALKSVEGIPRVLFHGITIFRGEKYRALVTGIPSQRFV